MQTKTTLIEKYLLNAIERGEYMTGQPIPTRNQIAQMFHCSRTIVERAIASLSADGWLESGRGCRTIVRKELRRPTSIKRLNVISQHDCHRSISDVFCSFVADQDYFGIPVRWFPPDRAGIMASELCRQAADLTSRREFTPLILPRLNWDSGYPPISAAMKNSSISNRIWKMWE